MSDSSGAQSYSLLQFEVEEQLFAIEVTDLAGVQQRQNLPPNSGGWASDSALSGYAELVDLGYLFFGRHRELGGGSVLIAQAGYQLCPLLVDRVLPGTIVPSGERLPLPPPLADLELPFSGIFFKPDQWVVVVDTIPLMERISGLYPEAIIEAVLEHVE
jgi:hypothetical protein